MGLCCERILEHYASLHALLSLIGDSSHDVRMRQKCVDFCLRHLRTVTDLVKIDEQFDPVAISPSCGSAVVAHPERRTQLIHQLRRVK